MKPFSSSIENISDTARWVAFYRAMESERPDALFHDPYARLLAGERGEQITQTMPRASVAARVTAVRTCVFDEIILRLVENDGIDTVLNLAAGLDARPYRLPLPASLHWIEVDLLAILSYKQEKLVNEQPACSLERVPLNLTDSVARQALLARVGIEAQRVLVVAEGLLVYLTRDQVVSLASDLHASLQRAWWLTALISAPQLRRFHLTLNPRLSAGNTRMQFAPAEGENFFQAYGWRCVEFRSSLEEAHRLKREMPLGWLLRLQARISAMGRRHAPGKRSGFVLLERE